MPGLDSLVDLIHEDDNNTLLKVPDELFDTLSICQKLKIFA